MIVGLASEEDDEGKGAGTAKGNVNTSTKANPIMNLLIYNSKGEFERCKGIDQAVTKLDIMMARQIKKSTAEELPEVGKQMRERNKAILERIKNHPEFIDDSGKNYKHGFLEKKLFQMENGNAK